MKVIDIQSLKEICINNFEESEDFIIKNIHHKENFIVVELETKNCYDTTQNKNMYQDFLYSHDQWDAITQSFKNGLLLQSSVSIFTNKVNSDLYDYYIYDSFTRLKEKFNKHFNNIIDDYGIGFSTYDETDLKLFIKKDGFSFYDEIYILEKIAEYCSDSKDFVNK